MAEPMCREPYVHRGCSCIAWRQVEYILTLFSCPSAGLARKEKTHNRALCRDMRCVSPGRPFSAAAAAAAPAREVAAKASCSSRAVLHRT